MGVLRPDAAQPHPAQPVVERDHVHADRWPRHAALFARLLDHPLAVEFLQGAGATFMVTVQPYEPGIEQSRLAVEAYLHIFASILVVEGDALVPCDFRLPSGSGLDVLRFARARASGTLCVLITGEAPWKVNTIAAQDGMPVLRKPVSPADFARALQSPARAGTEQSGE
jgi:CheY-like chemotaxis protein